MPTTKIVAYGNRVFICTFLFSALGLLLYILLSTCTQWAKWSISSVADLKNDTCSYLRLNQNISSLVCYLLVLPTMEIDGHKDLYWNQNKNHFSRCWIMGWQLTRDVIKCYLCCIIHQFPNMYPAIIQILLQWNLKFFTTNRGDAHGMSAALLGTEWKHWLSLHTDGSYFAVPGNLVPKLQAEDS